jgi:hypothetical protein
MSDVIDEVVPEVPDAPPAPTSDVTLAFKAVHDALMTEVIEAVKVSDMPRVVRTSEFVQSVTGLINTWNHGVLPSGGKPGGAKRGRKAKNAGAAAVDGEDYGVDGEPMDTSGIPSGTKRGVGRPRTNY